MLVRDHFQQFGGMGHSTGLLNRLDKSHLFWSIVFVRPRLDFQRTASFDIKLALIKIAFRLLVRVMNLSGHNSCNGEPENKDADVCISMCVSILDLSVANERSTSYFQLLIAILHFQL